MIHLIPGANLLRQCRRQPSGMNEMLVSERFHVKSLMIMLYSSHGSRLAPVATSKTNSVGPGMGPTFSIISSGWILQPDIPRDEL